MHRRGQLRNDSWRHVAQDLDVAGYTEAQTPLHAEKRGMSTVGEAFLLMV